jgi:hypothetical protein
MDTNRIKETLDFIRQKKHDAEDKISLEISRIKNNFEEETGLSISDICLDLTEVTTLGDRDPRYIISGAFIIINEVKIN